MRPATERDEEGIAALAAIAGGSGWWGWEQRVGADRPDRRRHVETEGDKIVGYGCIWRRRGVLFGLDALVDPGQRHGGLGGRIVDQLFKDLGELGAGAVEARIDADHQEALNFMVRRGFFELNRLERLKLELAGVTTDDAVPPGIEIRPLGDVGDPAQLQPVIELVTLAFTEPRSRKLEPFNEPPVLQLGGDLEDAPPGGCFLAWSGDQCVGLSGLTAGPEPDTLTAFMTAIHPEHRHKGIARALKQRTIAFASRNGYRAIFSNSPNPNMRDLNELLGFQRCAATEIRMGRRL